MKVHHIGYAVDEMDGAIKKFEDLGYALIGEKTEDKLRKVVIAFVKSGDTLVELIAPSGTGSPVDRVIEKNGATPYHICYEVEDIAETCSLLKKEGWTILIKPAPAPAISGAPVAFLYNKIIGLIELVEKI